MRFDLTVELRLDKLNRLPASVKKKLADMVAQYAEKVQEEAKRGCVVRTGSAQASVWRKTWKYDDYDISSSQAILLNPKVKIQPKPPEAVNQMNAIIGVSAQHAWWIEYGGGANKAAPRPFLVPAMLKFRGEFLDAARRAVNEGAAGA